jgi:hypothetical protein
MSPVLQGFEKGDRFSVWRWQYPTNEGPTTAFAYALVGGGTDEAYKKSFIVGDTEERPNPLSLWKIYEKCCLEDGEVYQAMRRKLEMTGNGDTRRGVGIDFYSGGGAEGGTAWSYQHRLVSIFRRHWFFITDGAYFGLALLNTQSTGEREVLASIVMPACHLY